MEKRDEERTAACQQRNIFLFLFVCSTHPTRVFRQRRNTHNSLINNPYSRLTVLEGCVNDMLMLLSSYITVLHSDHLCSLSQSIFYLFNLNIILVSKILCGLLSVQR